MGHQGLNNELSSFKNAHIETIKNRKTRQIFSKRINYWFKNPHATAWVVCRDFNKSNSDKYCPMLINLEAKLSTNDCWCLVLWCPRGLDFVEGGTRPSVFWNRATTRVLYASLSWKLPQFFCRSLPSLPNLWAVTGLHGQVGAPGLSALLLPNAGAQTEEAPLCPDTHPACSVGLLHTYIHWVSESRSVVPDSLRPHGWQPARPLCPWDSPGKKTGVGCLSFSRGSSPPRDQTRLSWVSCTVGGFFTTEPPGRPPG